jgi:hypothetical protein
MEPGEVHPDDKDGTAGVDAKKQWQRMAEPQKWMPKTVEPHQEWTPK